MSAITAAALLFGFASCAGDLHDDIINPIDLSGGYYLVGSMSIGSDGKGWANTKTTVFAFEETETAGSYNVPFSADAAEVAFAFIPTPGSWAGQIGGDKMVAGTLPSGAKFESKDNGNDGENGTISGLEANGKYKLTVTALDDGTLKIDCSSNVPPVPHYLDGMYLVGTINGWGSGMTKDYLLWKPIKNEAKGILTYSIDILVTSDTEQIVLSTSDWKKKYGITTIEVGKDYVELETKENADDVGNAKITGLTAGSNYRFYVQTTSDQKVFMKVVALTTVEVTPTVSVSGLPEALNGTTLYFTGDFNGWKEPAKSGSIECKVVNGTVSVTLPKTSKVFETGEEEAFSYQGKFSSAGWKRPEITNDAGENISFKVTKNKFTVKGTFKGTKEHKDGGTQYLCDWTVE